MTFLFNDDSVYKVWYEIAQETGTYYRADLWGLLDAQYHPGEVEGAEEARLAFMQELAARMPTRPFDQLEEDFAGVNAAVFTKGLTPEHLTTYGLVVNGVHYRGCCPTCYGEYPYCDFIRMPSYSTAKTAFVALALMRLAQEYGAQVPDLLVKDYVPETANSPGDWSTVTFNNTLDMATGNYEYSTYMVDEEERIFADFFGVETYAEKIEVALDWPNSAAPGTRWVYHSSDVFILVTAMQNYLRSQQGEDTDLFGYVVDEVYRPLGLGAGFFQYHAYQ